MDIQRMFCRELNKYRATPRRGKKSAYLSYNNWAIDKILQEIDISKENPGEVIESLIKEWDHLSTMNSNTSAMFSTIKNIAELALDIWIGIERRNK